MREISTAMFEQIQSDIYTQNSCAHDEIFSPSSDHNVKIEHPMEKPTFIRLLPSLFTILGVIWKTQRQLPWLKVELSEDQNLENCQQGITLLIFLVKQLNIVFEQNLGSRVNAVRNQSVGNLVIYNLEEKGCEDWSRFEKKFWRWRKTWNQDIHKTLEFSRELFHSLRWRKSPRRKTFQTSGEVFDTGNAYERVDYAALHIMCYVTLTAGTSICTVWQFLWKMKMATCFIPTVFLCKSSWKSTDKIYNVLWKLVAKCTT